MTLEELFHYTERRAREADILSDTAGDTETHQWNNGFAEAMREIGNLLVGRCK